MGILAFLVKLTILHVSKHLLLSSMNKVHCTFFLLLSLDKYGRKLCLVLSYVFSHSVKSDSLWPVDFSSSDSSAYGIFEARNTGVGCHFLLQGIFPTQGSNPSHMRLLHWQAGKIFTISAPWEALVIICCYC